MANPVETIIHRLSLLQRTIGLFIFFAALIWPLGHYVHWSLAIAGVVGMMGLGGYLIIINSNE